uniref:Uncharacterized protein n=1 Tax=Kwoniella dejecticola CBS 10117 TaxID=1296121 RepID=A0A1A6A7P7_9TREE|nr:uncharacterized protein I303_03795 [Kwoniella dejecticola CBS 10117]OBR86077.1 hypothetical protein I303_03795 [Kwoniella dejecticola CBS 10117]
MPKSKLADSGHNAQRPYDRPIMSTKSSQVRPERSMLDLPQVKSQTSASTSTSTRKTKKGEYDKTLIVTLVLKTAKDVKWESIVTEIGKTTTRQSILTISRARALLLILPQQPLLTLRDI